MISFRRGALFGIAMLALGAGQPALAQSGLETARGHVAAGRYVDALAAYGQAIAAQPDAEAYGARANLFVSLGQWDFASRDYRAGVALKPEDGALQGGLCTSLAMINHDLDGALKACDAAVKLEPTNFTAFSARGYTQLRRGAWAEAEQDYLMALGLNPAAPNEMFGHGIAQIHLGRGQQGRDEMASATLDSASLVWEWQARGFGLRGEILPGRPLTQAGEVVTSVKDQKVFLNPGEAFVELAGGCGRIVASGQTKAAAGQAWSGDCRFGLIHGAGSLGGGAAVRFVYGRAAGADEATVMLAYKPAEDALAL